MLAKAAEKLSMESLAYWSSSGSVDGLQTMAQVQVPGERSDQQHSLLTTGWVNAEVRRDVAHHGQLPVLVVVSDLDDFRDTLGKDSAVAVTKREDDLVADR
ncbi:hypothetical protein HBH52_074150 [Parastagonospora nodorum]|nr:hypothetical protein HBH52_074150 [Parastagonospora nodorum]